MSSKLSVFLLLFQVTAINGKQETRKECRYAYDSDTTEQLYSLLCAQQLFQDRRQFSVFPPGIGSSKMIFVSFEIR